MARLVDLPERIRANIEALDCPNNTEKPWVTGVPLAQRKVALISSAGLMLRGQATVRRGAADYRAIPHEASANEILMSHVSVNFDRTGYQQDLNAVLPRDRLNELVENGTLAAAAEIHYSFMGATEPEKMRPYASELAEQLHKENVDSALLLPV